MSTHRRDLLGLLTIVVIGLLLYSCSSVKEVSDSMEGSNEFFDPSETVTRNRETAAVGQSAARNEYEEGESKGKVQLTEPLLAQGQRLKNILDQLNSRTEQRHSLNVAVHQLERSIKGVETNRTSWSDREVIEFLKQQNAQLIDVVEQLKDAILQQGVSARRRSEETSQNQTGNHKTLNAAMDANLNYGRAIRLYEERKYSDAIVVLERLLLRSKNDDLTDNCRFWIGVSYFNLQRYNQAIPQFKHLLAHQWFEKREATYIMLGQCYEQSGDPSLAKATYQRLVQLNPVCDLAYVAHLKISML